MYFDWVTWGIWSIGLIILIVWIYVPAREFSQLIRDRRKRNAATRDKTSASH